MSLVEEKIIINKCLTSFNYKFYFYVTKFKEKGLEVRCNNAVFEGGVYKQTVYGYDNPAPKIFVKDNIVTVAPWKGRSGFEVHNADEFYIVREFRKDKETSEVKHIDTEVSKRKVDELFELLMDNYKLGEKASYRDIVRLLDEKFKFSICEDEEKEDFVDHFNGGRYRAKYYFPQYYYPIKVLEALQKVVYFGRGGVALKKEMEL